MGLFDEKTVPLKEHPKIFSDSVSNSPKYSRVKFDPALCRKARDHTYSFISRRIRKYFKA
jgi:hypothetical protein